MMTLAVGCELRRTVKVAVAAVPCADALSLGVAGCAFVAREPPEWVREHVHRRPARAKHQPAEVALPVRVDVGQSASVAVSGVLAAVSDERDLSAAVAAECELVHEGAGRLAAAFDGHARALCLGRVDADEANGDLLS